MLTALKGCGHTQATFTVVRDEQKIGQIKGIIEKDNVGHFVDTTVPQDVKIDDTLIDADKKEYTVIKVGSDRISLSGIPAGGMSFKIYYVRKEKPRQPLINNVVNINNTNSVAVENNIDISATVETVQTNINNMSSLSDEETKLALQKVNELAEIIKSKENRKQKWSKVASVFKWLAEKSVDLACAFSPMIMQALQSLY